MVFKSTKDGKITVTHVLFPVTLIAFVLFIMLAFQSSQILTEHEALNNAKTQQEKPLEEADKVQKQLDALAVGTKKLADQGNKSAQAIIARMKQLGITVKDAPKPMPGASAPAAGTVPTAAPKAKAPASEDTPD